MASDTPFLSDPSVSMLVMTLFEFLCYGSYFLGRPIYPRQQDFLYRVMLMQPIGFNIRITDLLGRQTLVRTDFFLLFFRT